MKPLILDFITPRTIGSFAMPFEYDEQTAVNTISVNGVNKVFIDLNPSDTELLTKTKVQRESEDENFSLLELGTKTKYGETEDLHDYLMELQTKTLKAREQDE